MPGVIAKKDVRDIVGRPGVEFVLPASSRSVNLGTILSVATHQYLGQVSWYGQLPPVWKKQGGGWRSESAFADALYLLIRSQARS